MSGRRIPSQRMKILPTRIEERASTRGLYSDDPLAQRIIAFFGEHLSERTGADEVAAAVGIGKRQLERHFAEHVGRPITSYLRELRLIRAHQLVMETDDPFGTIARVCGFSNPQHFSNAYRAAYGTTPSKARSKKQID